MKRKVKGRQMLGEKNEKGRRKEGERRETRRKEGKKVLQMV